MKSLWFSLFKVVKATDDVVKRNELKYVEWKGSKIWCLGKKEYRI